MMASPLGSWVVSVRVIALALIVLAIAAYAFGSSGGDDSPTQISLDALVLGPEQWQGKRVEVSGTLLQLTDPDGTVYDILEDPAQNRIGLRDVDGWDALIGQPVVATGIVSFDDAFGWFLADPSVVAGPN